MIGENHFISKQIGTFRLLSELSSGQLSSTYIAEQAHPSPRTVVFKLFHGVHLPERSRSRFLQEVRLLKKVRQPHILPVLDGGFYGDSPYIVSVYAKQGSLRDYLHAQAVATMPTQDAIALIANVGRALQFFHQINITHRNLKPENILFNEQGEVLIADCSIMALVDSVPVEQAYKTNTFPYMAPEQFYGRANKESDQYALGCIAHELLTGVVPFAGSGFQQMAKKHESEEPVPPTQLNMLLPEYMQKAMLRAMAKQEAARYSQIKDFVAALMGSTKSQNVAKNEEAAIVHPVADSADMRLDAYPAADEAVNIVVAALPDEPSDTPVTSEESEPIPSVQSEPDIEGQPAVILEEVETPQPIEDDRESEDLAHVGTDEIEEEKPVPLDDIVTQPNLDAVLPMPEMLLAAGAVLESSEQANINHTTDMMAGAGLAGSGRQTGRATVGSNWFPLPGKFLLLVGVSWILIALLILSMVYIIIPSAHPFTNGGTIVKKVTQQPVAKPTPAKQPTVRPTASPTARPTPSPTPIVTPSPTVTPIPSPSPSPITVPTLSVSPTSLNGPSDCQSGQIGFKCTVTLSLPQNFSGNARWTASVNGNITAFFIPQRGTLSPGQQQTVTIFVGKSCSHNGSFIFSTQDSKVAVAWSC